MVRNVSMKGSNVTSYYKLYEAFDICVINSHNMSIMHRLLNQNNRSFRFVSFLFNVPVNNFSVMSGRSHRFLGITSTFWEVNVSCSRTQHGDLSEDRTPDLSLRSPTLYH